jgi:hypothetical protein
LVTAAMLVRVGEFHAALTLALATGSGYRTYRTYRLHWSDGASDRALIGNVEGAEVVEMARSVYYR